VGRSKVGVVPGRAAANSRITSPDSCPARRPRQPCRTPGYPPHHRPSYPSTYWSRTERPLANSSTSFRWEGAASPILSL
jgi:hypothetical protein